MVKGVPNCITKREVIEKIAEKICMAVKLSH